MKIEESYLYLRGVLDQARDAALQQLEDRAKLRQVVKKRNIVQQEGVEAALQYGERLVASCSQDQVDLLQPLVQDRLLNMLNLEQGCGEDQNEGSSSLLWEAGDKDIAERALQVRMTYITKYVKAHVFCQLNAALSSHQAAMGSKACIFNNGSFLDFLSGGLFANSSTLPPLFSPKFNCHHLAM